MKLANLLCHPIDNFVAFKENIRRQSPIEKWHFIRNIAQVLLRLIGIHIHKKTVNLHSLLPGLALVDYFLFLPYTFYLYRNDVMRALQLLCVIVS